MSMVDKNIFIQLAEHLLLQRDHFFYRSPLNGDFGFEYMKDYSGKMAEPPKTGRNAGKVTRPKQGLFDIRIFTGRRYAGKVTHRNLFEDILEYSSEKKCLQVWRGEDQRTIGRSDDEKESLVVMALLMFEQEANWGNEIWQRWSNFNPKPTKPKAIRPRDMLMGYVRQAFTLGLDRLDDLKYWMKTKPGTASFANPNGTNRDFKDYPQDVKRFFDELSNMDGTEAIMVGEMREKFRQVANKAPNNRDYKVIEVKNI